MNLRSSRRSQPPPAVRVAARLSPLPSPPSRPGSGSMVERCERDGDLCDDTIAAAAARSPPKKFRRLQTLTSLAQQHVEAMHEGDFVARSRLRWRQQQQLHANDDAPAESDAAHALRVSHESAALVVQSAWRRSAAVRLRARLVRNVWQQLAELAAWLARDRLQLQAALHALQAPSARPLVALDRHLRSPGPGGCRLRTLRGACVRLPALLLATWLCFSLGLERRSRFLRRPAPAILQAVHVPVRKTCRLLAQLWRETARLALRAIQCRARAFLARRKYWTLLTAHRRSQAARRLQTVYRAWIARRLLWRLRRRRAAIRVQCAWRCHGARRRVQHRRVALVAAQFLAGVTLRAVDDASVRIVQHAARHIQRVVRGQWARAKFRALRAAREQLKWQKNPSKGYRLFDKRQYVQAAVYLERCFRQGIFQDEQASNTDATTDHEADGVETSRRGGSPHPHRRLAPSGSKLAYSFSESPATLEGGAFHSTYPRGADYRRPAAIHEAADGSAASAEGGGAAQLRFWQTYALSHWFSFQSNGDPLHLQQARVGFGSYLRIDASAAAALPGVATSTQVDAEMQFLRLHARFCLVQCVDWSSGSEELALSLCVELLDELELFSGLTTAAMVRDATAWRAQLLMTSAALYLKQNEYDACYAQLQALLTLTASGNSALYELVDLQFLLAFVLLQSREREAARRAESHLQCCFQTIELWAGVGFYLGAMSSSRAAARLQDEPVGSFLLHHEAVELADADGGQAAAPPKLLLKVKLSDAPCKVSSIRIHYDDGRYHMKKLPNCTHFSVHELIQQLPKAAGVQWTNGVRRSLYVPALEMKLLNRPDAAARRDRRALLLSWEQWSWRLGTNSARHNETWGALCQLFAVRLEAGDAFAVASCVARDGLVAARNCVLRAELFFVLGRSLAGLQRRVDATLAMQQAAIERGRLPASDNFAAVARALARVGSQSHAFARQLDRAAKLERMSVKAWAFDSSAPSLRGRPFCEALLLQRVDDETSGDVADTFFLRALLRAHVKAFVGSSGASEQRHLELAFGCVQRLFERFHDASLRHHDAVGDAVDARACCRHVGVAAAAVHDAASTTVRAVPVPPAFSLHALLLSWHRMPFHVAFEMAEVLYRWPRVGGGARVDALESLYGRLRSARPRSGAYAAFEELLLVRLAFLYAQRSSASASATTTSASAVALMRKAVELLDELVALRRLRALGSRGRVAVQRVQWPTPLRRLPERLSLDELVFLRGFLWEKVSELHGAKQKDARARAWRDFDALHRTLLASVAREQQRERECTRLTGVKGVRVHVGDTADVEIADVLHSRPYVVVQCDKQPPVATQHAATWMNQLSPGWNEHVELDVASAKARVAVVVMNRSTRLRRAAGSGGGDHVIGYVQVSMEELLARGAAMQCPQWFPLVRRDADDETAAVVASLSLRGGKRPRIRLAFQVTTQSAKPASGDDRGRQKTRMAGNWAVGELQRYVHGDLRRFVAGAWVWRWFARQWLVDGEFGVAAWFLQHAISKQDEPRTQQYAVDLVDLARCHRATMGDAWREAARPLLEQAAAILQRELRANAADGASLRTQLAEVSRMLATQPHGDDDAPLATELAKTIPASSHWIAMRRRRHDDDGDDDGETAAGGTMYYFNEDTWERFRGVAGEPRLREPLEWEVDQGDALVATSRDPLRPRRVVVLSAAMRARVEPLCRRERDRHAADPHRWVAVFNPRRLEMQFLSLTVKEGDDDDGDDDGDGEPPLSMTTTQPPAYAMVADEFTMYHVLVAQDAVRAYLARRWRRRRRRGLLASAVALVRARHAAERRLAARTEAARRRRLNCLHVVVEKASGLRAMDLLSSDPLVVLELVGADGAVAARGETSAKANTRNPKWHEEFRFHYAYADHAVGTDGGTDDGDGDGDGQRQHAPVLRLTVFDQDIIQTFRRDDVEAKQLLDEQDDEDGDGDGDAKPARASDGNKRDFLGLAVAPLAPLVHGKCVSAELQLRDEDGFLESPRPRGSLFVAVQWLHDADHDLAARRRHAVKPMLLVRPRKRTRPKPAFIHSDLLDEAVRTRAALLARMAELGVALDQLVRLFHKWRVAQALGRTADEAKLLEQRLAAAMATAQPFHGKRVALLVSAEAASEAVARLLRAVAEPVDDLIETSEKDAAEAYRATLARVGEAIRGAAVPTLATDADASGVDGFAAHARRVLTLLPHAVATWRREVMVLVETFFAAPTPAWDEPKGGDATLQQYVRIATLLQEAVEDRPRPTSPKKAAVALALGVTTPAIPATAAATSGVSLILTVSHGDVSSPSATTPVATSPPASTPSAAVAKRMERIERERRKATKKQQQQQR